MDNDFATQVEYDEGGLEEKPDRRIWVIVVVVLVVLCCCCVVLGVGGYLLWQNGDQWLGLVNPLLNQLI
jgi:cytochrome c-type biogenesis protein CcmH/NrfG